jgi:hypothetical protein
MSRSFSSAQNLLAAGLGIRQVFVKTGAAAELRGDLCAQAPKDHRFPHLLGGGEAPPAPNALSAQLNHGIFLQGGSRIGHWVLSLTRSYIFW